MSPADLFKRRPPPDERPPELRMPTIRDRRQIDLEDAIRMATVKKPPTPRKPREKRDG